MERRDFLKLAGLTAAMALGCTRRSKLLPYHDPMEDVVPGTPTWYATTCLSCPAGCGVLAKCREGRVVKLEGNPRHPVNQGSLCARGQAAFQGVYSPDRLATPLKAGKGGDFDKLSWTAGLALLQENLSAAKGKVGFWTGLCADPLAGTTGLGRTLVFEPLAHESLREGNRIVFGRHSIPAMDLKKADFLLSVNADLSGTWISPVSLTRQLIQARAAGATFLYAGPRLSVTGAAADQWVPVQPGRDAVFLLALLQAAMSSARGRAKDPRARKAVEHWSKGRSVNELSAHAGVAAKTVQKIADRIMTAESPLVLTGGDVDAVVAANFLTWLAGGEKAFDFGRPSALDRCAGRQEIEEFIAAMARGSIKVLIVHRSNPVFTLPPSLDFAKALEKVPFTVVLAEKESETTRKASLVLPITHALESWGGVEPVKGLYCTVQPVMRPEVPARGTLEILGAGLGVKGDTSSRQLLKQLWGEGAELRSAEDEQNFQTLLQSGFREIPLPSETAELSDRVVEHAFSPPPKDEGLAADLYPSVKFYDGRDADKPWLEELPDPITRITWGQWVEVQPETARDLKIEEGDLVTVSASGGSLILPAHLYSGLASKTVALPLGQGHVHYGRFAEPGGQNPWTLGGPAVLGVTLKPTGESIRFANTDGSRSQHGRGLARRAKKNDPGGQGKASGHGQGKSIYPAHAHDTYRWAMAVDLDRCTGCGACAVACQAENNVAVVGRDDVARGREMAWLHVERFIATEPNVTVDFLPLMCQHCDAAPCEAVCPVYAPHHNKQGLNVQVYNRCVGTRFCGVNCPYKVRRFNWRSWSVDSPLHRQFNPDVTVRTKGVMEKCSFCVQRIRAGLFQAKKERRHVRDGEIRPACAQTCPAGAIVFGNLLDKGSQVWKQAHDERAYSLLPEANTAPAVYYLRRIRRSL